MSIPLPPIGPAGFLRRSRGLLASASRLLGVHLALYDAHGRPLAGAAPQGPCEGCPHGNSTIDACFEERRQKIRRALAGGEHEWFCARGLRLSVHPLPLRRGNPVGLVAVGPDSAVGTSGESGVGRPGTRRDGACGIRPSVSGHRSESASGHLGLAKILPFPTGSGDGGAAAFGIGSGGGSNGRSNGRSNGDSKGERRDDDVDGTPACVAVDAGQGTRRDPAASRLRRRRRFLRHLVRLLADQYALYHEVCGLSQELSARYDELHMLYSIAGRLGGENDLQRSLSQMLAQAREAVEADAAVVSIGDRKLLEGVVRAGLPVLSDETRRAWRGFAREIAEALHNGGQRYRLGFDESPAGRLPLPGPLHWLAVTILRSGEPIGYLALLRIGHDRSFRSREIKLLESLSEQAAMAVANTELYEDLRDFLMATVKSLVSAIEAKDAYTSGHSERVNLLSMLLGRQLGLGSQDMETLRWASILHDVGKIGMPEQILCKPGRLTPEEYEVIKEHPERGHRLLKPIRQLSEAAVCVRAHHERIDGGGYPDGLVGPEIPRLARIVAVADTYDALTSTRSYRTARTLDFALDEIRRVRGTQLDPEVVDALLALAPFLREHQVMIRSASEAVQEEAA